MFFKSSTAWRPSKSIGERLVRLPECRGLDLSSTWLEAEAAFGVNADLQSVVKRLNCMVILALQM
jgi:hypothetical protein